MYIPKGFREDDILTLHTFMRTYSFATLVTQHEGEPFATHLPFLLDTGRDPHGTLLAHMARANPQWHDFNSAQEVLVIFQGPHAYISPSWYEVELSVPTWNYATVHAYGFPRLIDDMEELYTLLKTLIQTHEAQFEKPWPFQLPGDYMQKMMRGIVGFEIEITRLEGKFKLSQNRSATERERNCLSTKICGYIGGSRIDEKLRITGSGGIERANGAHCSNRPSIERNIFSSQLSIAHPLQDGVRYS